MVSKNLGPPLSPGWSTTIYYGIASTTQVALPMTLRVGGSAALYAAKLFDKNIVQTTSGLAYIGARLLHGASKGLEKIDATKVMNVASSTMNQGVGIVTEETKATQRTAVDAAATGISMIPGIGPFLAMGTKAIGIMGETNLRAAQQHTSIFCNAIRALGPAIGAGGSAILSTTAKTSDWLSRRLFAIYEDPEDMQSQLLGTASTLYSTADKVEKNLERHLRKLRSENEDIETTPTEAIALEILQLEEQVARGTLPYLTAEEFLRLPPAKQEAIIFIIEQAGIIPQQAPTRKERRNAPHNYYGKDYKKFLTGETCRKFIKTCYQQKLTTLDALSDDGKGKALAIAKCHNQLRDKQLIPEEFKHLDILDKIKIIRIVKEQGQLDLTWQTFLEQNLPTSREKWDTFSEQAQKIDSQFFDTILQKFITLNASDQLLNLSQAQIQELLPDERNAVIAILISTLEGLDAQKHQTTIQHLTGLLQTERPLDTDLKFLEEAFARHLSPAMKAAIRRQKEEKIEFVTLSPEEMKKEISRLEEELKILTKTIQENTGRKIDVSTENRKVMEHIQALAVLRAHYETLVPNDPVPLEPILNEQLLIEELIGNGEAKEPINMAAIHCLINDRVFTPNLITQCFERLGALAELGATVSDKGVKAIAAVLKPLVGEKTFTVFFNGVLPILAKTGWGQESIRSVLNQCTLTPEELGKMLVDMSCSIMQLVVDVEGWILNGLDALQAVRDYAWDTTMPVLQELKEYAALKETQVGLVNEETVKGLTTQCSNQLQIAFTQTSGIIWSKVSAVAERNGIAQPTYEEFMLSVTQSLAKKSLTQNDPQFWIEAQTKLVSFQEAFIEGILSKAYWWQRWFSGLRAQDLALWSQTEGYRLLQYKSGVLHTALAQYNTSEAAKAALAEMENAWMIRIAHFLQPSTQRLTKTVEAIETLYETSKSTSDTILDTLHAAHTVLATNMRVGKEQTQLLINDVSTAIDTVTSYVPQSVGDFVRGAVGISPRESRGVAWVAGKTAAYALAGSLGYLQSKIFFDTLATTSPAIGTVLAPMLGETTTAFLDMLCKGTELAKTAVAPAVHATVANIGRTLQEIDKDKMNMLAKELGAQQEPPVDAARIENFAKLSDNEQDHLCYLVLSSKQIDEDKKQELYALYDGFINTRNAQRNYYNAADTYDATEVSEKNAFEQLNTEALRTKKAFESYVTRLLQSYDHLTPEERTFMSPALFDQLDEEVKNRVIKIVKEEKGVVGISQGKEALISFFNSLPQAKKQRMTVMTKSQFYSLSEEEQHNILFIASQTNEYVVYCNQKERKQSKKHITSQQIEIDTMIRHARPRRNYSDEQLNKLLTIYATMDLEKRAALTPNQLKQLGKEKILQIKDIVDRLSSLHAHGGFSKYQQGFLKLPEDNEHCLRCLAILYNHTLIPQHKLLIYNISEEQIEALLGKKTKEIFTYIEAIQNHHKLLTPTTKDRLVQIATRLKNEEKLSVDDLKTVVSLFNELSSEIKLQLFQEQILAKTITNKAKEVLQNECRTCTETCNKLQRDEKKLEKTLRQLTEGATNQRLPNDTIIQETQATLQTVKRKRLQEEKRRNELQKALQEIEQEKAQEPMLEDTEVISRNAEAEFNACMAMLADPSYDIQSLINLYTRDLEAIKEKQKTLPEIKHLALQQQNIEEVLRRLEAERDKKTPAPEPIPGTPASEPIPGTPASEPIQGQPAPEPIQGPPAPEPIQGPPAPETIQGPSASASIPESTASESISELPVPESIPELPALKPASPQHPSRKITVTPLQQQPSERISQIKMGAAETPAPKPGILQRFFGRIKRFSSNVRTGFSDLVRKINNLNLFRKR